MKRILFNEQKGFTLIELLIVIAIIAILASIAIPQYMKYQQKAKVSSYAAPIARACLMDLAAYCIENPSVSITLSTAFGKNCTDASTPGGNVTLSGDGYKCNDVGSLTAGSVIGALANVGDYSARCTVTTGGVKCTVD